MLLVNVLKNNTDITPSGITIEGLTHELTALKYSSDLTHGRMMGKDESDKILAMAFGL
jgi:hypothetical protein